jgi:monovalent cation:H+ antiporter-2, CPA2 family
LSQIGEFSFILGQAGIMIGLLNRDQYSLILAGALLSITVNPLMFRLITPTENSCKIPAPLAAVGSSRTHAAAHRRAQWSRSHCRLRRVGRHIVNLLEQMKSPVWSSMRMRDASRNWSPRSIPTLYGDASNSEVLTHAGLPAPAPWSWPVPTNHPVNWSSRRHATWRPTCHIIARATTEEGINHLAELGAQDVIHPELEGGLEIVRHTLLKLGFPVQEIIRYMDAVRHDHYDMQVNTEEEHRLLHDLIHASENIEVTWMRLEAGNPIVGQTLAQANLRARTGASVVAIMRGRELMANPKSSTVFEEGDRVGFIGDEDQVEKVEKLFSEIETVETGVEWET